MPIGTNRYGKGSVRVVKAEEADGRWNLKDITVHVRVEGDFSAAFAAGDNTGVLPTDTMRNTVYALAVEHLHRDTEHFALALADHFLSRNSQVDSVEVEIEDRVWVPIPMGEEDAPHAFRVAGPEWREATVIADRDGSQVYGGIENLNVLKTTGSAFKEFLRDEFTTLPDAEDRLLSTVITAHWLYQDGDIDFTASWEGIRRVLISEFAKHESLSVQHTLLAMGEAVLDHNDMVEEISISLPNIHHLPFDISRFPVDDHQGIFQPVDEPYGLIEGTVRRG